MAGKMPFWLHCNECGIQPDKAKGIVIIVTNCGHFFCQNCDKKNGRDKCAVCKKGPLKCAKIDEHLKPDIKTMLEDPVAKLHKLRRTQQFQESQSNKLIDKWKKHAKTMTTKAQDASQRIKLLEKKMESVKTLETKLSTENERVEQLSKKNADLQNEIEEIKKDKEAKRLQDEAILMKERARSKKFHDGLRQMHEEKRQLHEEKRQLQQKLEQEKQNATGRTEFLQKQHEEDVHRLQDMQQRVQEFQKEKRQQLEQIQQKVRHLEEANEEKELKCQEALQISMKEKIRSKELQDCVKRLQAEKPQQLEQFHRQVRHLEEAKKEIESKYREAHQILIKENTRSKELKDRVKRLQEEKPQQLEQFHRQVHHLEEAKREIEAKCQEAHQILMKEKMRSNELQDCVKKLEEEKRHILDQTHRQVHHLEEGKKQIESKCQEVHQILMKEKMRSNELQDCLKKLEEEKRQLQQENHSLNLRLRPNLTPLQQQQRALLREEEARKRQRQQNNQQEVLVSTLPQLIQHHQKVQHQPVQHQPVQHQSLQHRPIQHQQTQQYHIGSLRSPVQSFANSSSSPAIRRSTAPQSDNRGISDNIFGSTETPDLFRIARMQNQRNPGQLGCQVRSQGPILGPQQQMFLNQPRQENRRFP